FRKLALVDVAVAGAALAARALLAMRGYGPWSIVLGDVAAAALGAGLLVLLAPQPARVRGAPLVRDGLRIVGARAADALFAQADRFLVGRQLGAGALGLYVFGWQHAMCLVQRAAPLAEQVALPVLSRLQDDKPALARAYRTLTRINVAILVPAAAILWAFAPALVAWLYPERWQEAVPVLRALCVAAAAAAVNAHPGLLWLALGRTRLRLWWSLANLPVIALVVSAGLSYGPTGVAYALAIRSLAAGGACHLICRTLLRAD
ncbi:MAG: oligosaccharide flippase family protein, partial [Planctomycetota bacterium]